MPAGPGGISRAPFRPQADRLNAPTAATVVAMPLRLAGCRTGKQQHQRRRDCAQPTRSVARSEHCAAVTWSIAGLRAVDRGQGARPLGVFGGHATSGRPCRAPRLTTSAVASHSIGPRAGAYRQVGSSNCAGKRSRSRRCPSGCGSQPGHRPQADASRSRPGAPTLRAANYCIAKGSCAFVLAALRKLS
jgi:hypothetical protein